MNQILELEDFLNQQEDYFLYGYGINKEDKKIAFEFVFLHEDYKKLFDKLFDQIVIEQWMSEIINKYFAFIDKTEQIKFDCWVKNTAYFNIIP